MENRAPVVYVPDIAMAKIEVYKITGVGLRCLKKGVKGWRGTVDPGSTFNLPCIGL